jgi:hypothetical protein
VVRRLNEAIMVRARHEVKLAKAALEARRR